LQLDRLVAEKFRKNHVSQGSGKLLIAASGTGGHLFPAVAVASKLKGVEIEWMGVPDRLETRLVPKEYPMHLISVRGFQGKSIPENLKTMWMLGSSVFATRRILKKGKFTGVFSTGGYISAPAILAAHSLGLPVVLHESNALPGKVTRWLSPFCTRVAIGFNSAAQYLKKARTVYLGTPVREQFLQRQKLDLPLPEGRPIIVVAGGSQGAVALNNLVRECAPAWIAAGAVIVHLTGDRDPNSQALQDPNYWAMPFCDNMAGLLQRTTLIISRSGAATLTELMVCRVPSILIPYPFAAEDHQFVNANCLAQAGGALVFRQEKLSAALLSQEVLDLLQSPQRLQTMAYNTANMGILNSADLLADLIRELMGLQKPS
jgi:UDP-N-acetylglucosamine--N-acetylmuramyl-(pentapeptide) pyrophosphoryl-undecaprenol N-acetylglucosamine transferase